MGHDRGVTTIPADLLELAHAYGVATEFHDWRGRRVDVPEQTVTTVLAAMDVDVADPARALADREDARWARMLPRSSWWSPARNGRSRCTSPTATRSR